jgi:hypothetical protein
MQLLTIWLETLSALAGWVGAASIYIEQLFAYGSVSLFGLSPSNTVSPEILINNRFGYA